MARGWESKAVADQIEEGQEAREQQQSILRPTPEEKQKQDRLASLLMSKSRLLEQLEGATHPSYREILLKGLKAIEREVEELGSS